jgi:hypothetical protein
MPTGKKYQYLATEIDVPTGEKPARAGDPKPVKRFGPGLLSELGLSDKDVENLPRGVIRPATADEIEAADNRAATAEARQIAEEAALQRRNDEIEHANERRAIEREADQKKAEELSKLEDQRAEERAKEDQKLSAELNKAQGIAPQKSTAKK